MSIIKNNSITITIIFFAAVMTAMFFTYFEREEYQRYVGFRGEAARNPLYALQKYLEEFNFNVTSSRSINTESELPAIHSVLLISDRNFYKNYVLKDKIVSWVKAGGTLIMIAPYIGNEDQITLLRQPQITLRKISGASEDEEIDFLSNSYQLSIYRNGTIESPLSAGWKLSDNNGTYGAKYSVDEGEIVILTNFSFATNYFIEQKDHAALLYTMFNELHNKDILLVTNAYDLSILTLLLKNKIAVAIFVIAVILFLWYYLARFGPIYQQKHAGNHKLSVFLRSVGYYLWKSGNLREVIEQEKGRLRNRIGQRFPETISMNENDRYNYLGEHLSLNSQHISMLYQPLMNSEQREIYHTMLLLEKIGKKL